MAILLVWVGLIAGLAGWTETQGAWISFACFGGAALATMAWIVVVVGRREHG